MLILGPGPSNNKRLLTNQSSAIPLAIPPAIPRLFSTAPTTHDTNMPNETPTDLITPNEAAIIAKVTASTIRQWIHDGTIAGWLIVGRWRVSRGDVESLVSPFVPVTGRPMTKMEREREEAEVDRVLRAAKVRR